MSHDAHDVADIDKHIRVYLGVFAALLCLTILTVTVGYFKLPIREAIAVALLVACAKGTLVAGFFMHLFDEYRERRPILFWSLLCAVMGFFIVLIVPLVNYMDRLGQ